MGFPWVHLINWFILKGFIFVIWEFSYGCKKITDLFLKTSSSTSFLYPQDVPFKQKCIFILIGKISLFALVNVNEFTESVKSRFWRRKILAEVTRSKSRIPRFYLHGNSISFFSKNQKHILLHNKKMLCDPFHIGNYFFPLYKLICSFL